MTAGHMKATPLNVAVIERTEAQEFAIKLRELARQVDSGSVAYCLTYSVDLQGKVGELEFNKTATRKAFGQR